MFSRAQQFARVLEVKIVWRTEVYDLYGSVGGNFVERFVGVRKVQGFGGSLRSFRGAAENSLYGNAEAA
jgi:hypothetical protein